MLLLLAIAAHAADEPVVEVGGYVEVYGSWNANAPSNGVTNLRGFDDRANTVTLSNVVIDTTAAADTVDVHLAIQAGHTGAAYYAAEPAYAATGSAGPSDAPAWRNVQQATIGWHASDALTVGAGLFLSPIGPESMAAKDDWNFSRSDLFFGLPFYHTGAWGAFAPSKPWKLTIGVTNGWNSITDGNRDKSPYAQVAYTHGRWNAAILYFGGVERPEGAPEGKPWRHLADAWAQFDATDRVSFLVHADGGYEKTTFGPSTWAAGALYARLHPIGKLYVAARADWFVERAARDARGSAAPIFWPAAVDGVGRVASATLTADMRPSEHLSFRLEVRHDAANVPMFFAGTVAIDPQTGADIATATRQDTVTFAAIASF